MPVPGFDGSGNYVRQYSWTTDKANGVNITASRFDTEDNGFGAALSICVTRDGQGKMAADFTPASDATYKLGTVGLRWSDLNISGGATIGSNCVISGTLTIGAGINVRDATNLFNVGTVPNSHLPNVASGPGVTIQADPGGTPSGAAGSIWFYY